MANANHSRLVYPGEDGRLVYTADEDGNFIPDFSNCGYCGGGVALPDVPVRAEIGPDASKDDTARLQAAIDDLSARATDGDGFRGALLIRSGGYRIGGSLTVSASGVVLRGEGDGEDGTVLVGTGKGQRILVRVEGEGGPKEQAGTSADVADAFVPVGSRTFAVTDPGALGPGDRVIVHRPSTAEWIAEIGMDRIEVKHDKVRQWSPGEYSFQFERVVEAVDGKTVTLDAPIGTPLDARFGGGRICRYGWPDAVTQVGVEYLRGVSEYDPAIADRIDGELADEDHAWDFVAFNNARDCWVRNLTSKHFGYTCARVFRATRITIQDCACLDPVSEIRGGRRYSFPVNGQQVLVQRCRARHGRHDFVLHARAPGPNAYVDCVAEASYSDSGPHHRWSVATLFDNVTVEREPNGPKGGGGLNVQDRQSSGTGHGWAGTVKVFWNCTADHIVCQKPPTTQNYCIGCTGEKREGWHERPDGHWESHGIPVRPTSLSLAGLRDRLGEEAVRAVMTDEQIRRLGD